MKTTYHRGQQTRSMESATAVLEDYKSEYKVYRESREVLTYLMKTMMDNWQYNWSYRCSNN